MSPCEPAIRVHRRRVSLRARVARAGIIRDVDTGFLNCLAQEPGDKLRLSPREALRAGVLKEFTLPCRRPGPSEGDADRADAADDCTDSRMIDDVHQSSGNRC
jgi:hypothetical protein